MLRASYRPGDTDAFLRQNRQLLRLLDTEAHPPIKRLMFLSALAENFRELDEQLSSGKPLPAQWMNGREVVEVASEGGEASAEEIAPKEEET